MLSKKEPLSEGRFELLSKEETATKGEARYQWSKPLAKGETATKRERLVVETPAINRKDR